MAMRTAANCTIRSGSSLQLRAASFPLEAQKLEARSSNFMIPSVIISARGEERLRSGHPWIYRSDLADVRAEPGEAVAVRGPRNRTLGLAFYSSRSQIALRMLMRGHIEDPAAVGLLLRQRVGAALAFRESLAIDATACRLIHGEADLLPSLIVDRYGDYLVVQALSQGVDRLLPAATEMLVDVLKQAGILARN